MKNILLPTDFSENSMNAIRYALRFFENWEYNFYILNVQKISGYISDDLLASNEPNSVYESIAADNKKLINELVKKLSKEYKSQSYSFHGLFDYDDFVSAVDQAVQFHAIDLIVMGTNGATGAKEAVFGSNTLQVIRSLKCPVLTVPENYTYEGVNSALFSTHNCEDFSLEGVSVFKEMLNIHQAELNVLDIKDEGVVVNSKENDTYLKRLFTDYPYSYFLINSMPGLIAVNTATQLLKVDLHAVFIEKETFLKRLLFGSNVSQLAYKTLVPLLFLHR
ncbi:universal stress protein [unidentified eubacterium SCB49]|nr:universal stress protein [unidentified eubacterium SCB49]